MHIYNQNSELPLDPYFLKYSASYHLRTFKKCKFSCPSPDLYKQKLRKWGPEGLRLTSPAVGLDTAEVSGAKLYTMSSSKTLIRNWVSPQLHIQVT
jgi:hypothetical protein